MLDDVLAADLAGAQVKDCGHLAVGADASAMTAAHDCALAAAAAHEPFVLEWQGPGADVHLGHAFVGRGAFELRAYSYQGIPGGSGGDSDLHTTTTACASLDDLGDCGNDRPTSLCLACGGETALARCP